MSFVNQTIQKLVADGTMQPTDSVLTICAPFVPVAANMKIFNGTASRKLQFQILTNAALRKNLRPMIGVARTREV